MERCEICQQLVPDDPGLSGCEGCGRLYCPACNSVQDSVCLECHDKGFTVEEEA
jgi:hypothetical protein